MNGLQLQSKWKFLSAIVALLTPHEVLFFFFFLTAIAISVFLEIRKQYENKNAAELENRRVNKRYLSLKIVFYSYEYELPLG